MIRTVNVVGTTNSINAANSKTAVNASGCTATVSAPNSPASNSGSNRLSAWTVIACTIANSDNSTSSPIIDSMRAVRSVATNEAFVQYSACTSKATSQLISPKTHRRYNSIASTIVLATLMTVVVSRNV